MLLKSGATMGLAEKNLGEKPVLLLAISGRFLLELTSGSALRPFLWRHWIN